MHIQKNKNLKKYNTFSTNTKAKYFTKVKSIEECIKVIKKYPEEKLLILGEGSNTLLTKDWDGLVIKIEIKGRKKIKEDRKYAYIKVCSGENWDRFVKYTVRKNLAGIENLVMIPGTIGGAVSQNIAAYGQNITDTIQEIEVLDIESLETKVLDATKCGYRYRHSNFRDIWRNKYIITSAVFKLRKNTKELELSYKERAGRYGSLKEELESKGKEPYSIKDVMNAVIRQRKKRLPTVEQYGTCGSFFQNPLVTYAKYKTLAKSITDLQCYPSEDLRYENKEQYRDDELVKIPAGRLLDELGWKGKWEGNVGVSEKHALCVVTNKKATGKEIEGFVKKMQEDVKKKYNIDLHPEVNIL